MMPMADILFQVFDIESRWILNEEKRLDASFYAKDVIASRVLTDELKGQGIEIKTIKDLSDDIFWPGRFKRRYVTSKDGAPFLLPSEVIMFLPKAKKFITGYPEEVSTKKNWLLITRSGSIGRCLIVTKLLENAVLSDDLIRIVPKDKNNVGYLHAYLSSWIGQAFLTKDRYGATVKHIEPHHVAAIPIPVIPKLEKEINQRILAAHRLREEGQEYLLKAEQILYSELGLPEVDKDDVKYFGGENGRTVTSFETKASELNLRLDASYHTPILRLVKRYLIEHEAGGEYRLCELRNVADVFDLPTYKRIYVNPDEGLPILSGTHLRQMRLWDLKYISGLSFYKGGKSLINRYRIKKGWILTTERGTTGVSSLVTEYWDTWLASHNILRVVPNNINPGYLLAYLNTEYAQLQLKSKELGAVVEVLDPSDMEDIIVPVPEEDIQDTVGSIVIRAYDKRDKANQIEDEAVKLLETRLKEINP